jgi:acyl-coenzyme A synthetase/AMP-(fatty) acid ligase
VIISSGYRIAPAEIESALTSHGAVASAGVIGVPDEDRGEIPMAFVVPSDDTGAVEDDLKCRLGDHVKASLAKYSYPREIEFRDELPRTTSGKVDRSQLREE